MVTPGLSSVEPSDDFRCSAEVNAPFHVDAPTVVSHGPPWAAVAAPGPELPAEVLTLMPALNASRNARSTGSVYGFAPPLIEKLITSTPSRIAWLTAFTESELKQPASAQTRYMITYAPGATPE